MLYALVPLVIYFNCYKPPTENRIMKIKKILIIRFNAIGDVVHTTVIPYAIKQKHPECSIHYLTSPGNAIMLQNCNYIDKIIAFNDDTKQTIKDIRQEKYDIVISLNYTLKSYYLTFLSGAKKIAFRSYKGTSWVENYFHTAKKVYKDLELPPRLYMENYNRVAIEKVTNKLNQYPKPHIMINPGRYEGNARQGRIWHIDKWKTLSEKLLQTYGGTIFVNGSAKERDYHATLEDKGIVLLSGEFSLQETCIVLSMADLMISGDSGPLHIASAYNVKTLAILGSTSPQKIKPYGGNGYYVEPNIECKYCWKKKCKHTTSQKDYTPCIESITPDDVMEKIKKHGLL